MKNGWVNIPADFGCMIKNDHIIYILIKFNNHFIICQYISPKFKNIHGDLNQIESQRFTQIFRTFPSALQLGGVWPQGVPRHEVSQDIDVGNLAAI